MVQLIDDTGIRIPTRLISFVRRIISLRNMVQKNYRIPEIADKEKLPV